MKEQHWLRMSEAWTRLLLRLYPAHFREDLGEAVVEAYRDRYRTALRRGGVASLAVVWVRALWDSLRNGPGERVRPSIAWRRLGNWGRDSELVLRRLSRAPLFMAAMLGTLTVGLGAFAVVYAVVDKVLIEPLPYDDPDGLHMVWREYGWFELDRGALAGTDIVALDEAGGPIEGAVGLDRTTVTLGGEGDGPPQEVGLIVSSPRLFDFLGVQPALGRDFAASEVGPGRPAVVVLGHDVWSQRFSADPEIVGTDVHLDGEPHTVVGVMGRDVRFVQTSSLGGPEGADLYTTFDHDLAETEPGEGSYAGMIRARPGTPPEAVEAAVDRVGRMLDERDFGGLGLRLYPVGLQADLVSGVRPALTALGLAGLLLVLVLMVNLATLLLVRATQREREFAISRALGADRVALMRATLVEGGALGLLGGVGGVLAAFWATRALVAMTPLDLPRLEAIAVDWQVAIVVIGTGTLLGLIAAAVPASWATRTHLGTLLRATAVRGGGGHGRMRRGMVVVQVALALVLLSTGGLVVRSFEQLLRADPGFEPAGVLTLRVPIASDAYPDAAAVTAAQDRLHAELAALPGVRSVGAVSGLPLTAEASQTGVTFPGAPGNTGARENDEPLVDRFHARAGYLETMGISILNGRGFSRARPEGVREVVIDRTLADAFFPTGDPVGATLVLYGTDSLTVVGVAEHARQYDVHRDDRPQIYVRNEDYVVPSLSWALRTDRAPSSLASEARAAIWRIDPELAIADIRSMDQVVSVSLRQQRVSAVLISGFSLGALLLAAMGLYGMVAGSVTRRRHELAVRLALGAERGQVLRLVVREGMLLVLLGLFVGVPGVYLSTRVISALLVGISPFDPLTLAAVGGGL
ncbi:MAG: ADOP family duplicated permease, partial [Gemmatimonadota bacterium]